MAKRRPSPSKQQNATARAEQRPEPPRATVLHLLSDATGNLPQHMVAAMQTQFPPDTFTVRRHNFLTDPHKISAALARVAKLPGPVLHALISPAAKQRVEKACASQGWPCIDLTGPLLSFLAAHTPCDPAADVNLLHHMGTGYHSRMKALEFTLNHDDSLNLPTLHEADVVLAGVSRTSKTPTSVYLAMQGYRVGNVSLALGVEPPAELLALHDKVVGLVIDPDQLAAIRAARSAHWQLGSTNYSDPEMVDREVQWSRRLFRHQGWPILDVTRRSIEETAARIVELLGAGA